MGWNEAAWFSVGVSVALKSTVILCVAWLASIAMRRRPAAARHLVWTAAAAAVLALPVLTMLLPSVAIPGSGALLDSANMVFRIGASATTDSATQAATRVSPSPQKPQTAPWRPDWPLWLALLWAGGVVVALTEMLVACVRMWRIRRSAAASEHSQLAEQLARRLGIEQRVEVLETSEGTMPMTFGIVRPAVFLPRDASEWDEDRLRMVLLHELAHIRRGDVATQLAARAALSLHWWNPLAWTAWREFLKERERAADDLVLETGARASDYASHLLEVARTMRATKPLAWAAVAMARRSQLEGRLIAILDSHAKRNSVGRGAALAAAGVAIALVAPIAAVHAQDPRAAVPSDIEATIRAAAAQKNHEMLEKPAAVFESLRQYDTAKKLLESAVAIREEVSGSQSVEYGVGLIKLGDLERKRNRRAVADEFYAKAVSVLGDRPEAERALMHLGVSSLLKKDPAQAAAYFDQAIGVDPSKAGPATMWTAMMKRDTPAEAERLYRSALGMEDANSSDAATTMEMFAHFLQEQGRESEARDLMDRATATRKAIGTAAMAHYQRGADVLRIGASGVTPPKLVSRVEPAYTDEARLAKYQGTATIYVEVGPDGLAHNMQVTKGLGFGLDENAVTAISQWRFEPGTQNGVPVTVAAFVEVNFKLL